MLYVCVGAIREVWRSELRRQMSQRLAEERQAAEETRRFYNEELPDEDVAEEEAEFTDPDTSDHEFIQNEAEEEEGGGESEACSDLDEQEGVEGAHDGKEDDEREGVVSVKMDDGEEREDGDSVDGEEDEMDGYSAGEESDGGGYLSDYDDIPLSTAFSRSSKRKRLLESDDEEEAEVHVKGCGSSGSPLTSHGQSMPTATVEPSRRPGVTRSIGQAYEEASMGPLALNESFKQEEDITVDAPTSGDGDRDMNQPQTELTTVSVLPPREPILPAPSLPATGGVSTDSGMGGSLEEEAASNIVGDREDEESGEQHGEGGGEREEEDGDLPPTQAIPDSDRDNSLESSLLWAPSLAPAQPWSERSVDMGTYPTQPGVVSQWQSTAGFGQRYPDTQSGSLDDETQFLDDNG